MGTVPPPKPTDEHRAEAEAPEGDPSEAPVAQRAPGREPRKSARPPAEAPPVSAKSDEIENPPWTQAGIVACVGFVIGVLWPRLFGVHLSQTAPGLENPTSEVLVTWIWDHLKPAIPGLVQLVLRENDVSRVIFRG